MLKRSFVAVSVLTLCLLSASPSIGADSAVPAVTNSPAAAVPDKLPEVPAAPAVQTPAEKAPAQVVDSPAAVVPDKLPAVPAVPSNDMPAALKTSMENIQAALKAGDKTKAGELIKSLVIADHEKWFEKNFGADKAKKLAEEYAKFYKDMLQEGVAFFESTVKDEQFTINIIEIKGADDPNATGAQKEAMKAAKEPLKLYTVEFLKAGKEKGKKLWSFVIIDGAAKLAGKMRHAK